MNLIKVTKQSLRVMCAENGIKKYKSKNKGELINLLINKSQIDNSEPKIQSILSIKHDHKHKTDICEYIEKIDINFKKYVKGYHLINSYPINKELWEDANSLIFLSSGIDIYSKSDGGHLPGMDIDCSLGRISNKSAKYSKNKKSFDISSHRLTKFCSDKLCGTLSNIIEEINKLKNFDYYSFIVRDESDNQNISYDWLLIPSNYLVLDTSSYTWEPIIGTRGKNKDTQVGWKTNKINGSGMSITFSMSSQLWIHIEMTEEIKQFIISTTTVENKPIYNYIDLPNIINPLLISEIDRGNI